MKFSRNFQEFPKTANRFPGIMWRSEAKAAHLGEGVYHRNPIPNRAGSPNRADAGSRSESKLMRPHERTEITIETERTVVIRRRHATRAWCRECGREVEIVALEQAAALTGVTTTKLENFSQTQNWHCFKAQDGSLRICLEALLSSL